MCRNDRENICVCYYVGKPPEDTCKLATLKLKPNMKIMLMGSLEEDITQVTTVPDDIPEVVNDLDIEDEEVAVENMAVS